MALKIALPTDTSSITIENAEMIINKLFCKNIEFRKILQECQKKLGCYIDVQFLTVVENLDNDFPKCIDLIFTGESVTFSIGNGSEHSGAPIPIIDLQKKWINNFIQSMQSEESALEWFKKNKKNILSIT